PPTMARDSSSGNAGYQRPDPAAVVGSAAPQKPDRGDAPKAGTRGKAPDPPAIDRPGPGITPLKPADLTVRPPVWPREQVSTSRERPPARAARDPKVPPRAAPPPPTPVPLTREAKPGRVQPEPTRYMPAPAQPSPAAKRGKDVDQEPRKGPGLKTPN